MRKNHCGGAETRSALGREQTVAYGWLADIDGPACSGGWSRRINSKPVYDPIAEDRTKRRPVALHGER